jgi:hypothetical protein
VATYLHRHHPGPASRRQSPRHRPEDVKLAYGKVAEMQRRGVMHFHAIIRLGGVDPNDPTIVLPPPAQFGVLDLVDAVTHAAQQTAFTTDPSSPHPPGRLAYRLGYPTRHSTRHRLGGR